MIAYLAAPLALQQWFQTRNASSAVLLLHLAASTLVVAAGSAASASTKNTCMALVQPSSYCGRAIALLSSVVKPACLRWSAWWMIEAWQHHLSPCAMMRAPHVVVGAVGLGACLSQASARWQLFARGTNSTATLRRRLPLHPLFPQKVDILLGLLPRNAGHVVVPTCLSATRRGEYNYRGCEACSSRDSLVRDGGSRHNGRRVGMLLLRRRLKGELLLVRGFGMTRLMGDAGFCFLGR